MMGGKGLALQHEYIIYATKDYQPIEFRSPNVRKILDKAHSLIQKYGGATQQAKDEFSQWVKSAKGLSGGEQAYKYLDEQGRIYRLVAMTWPNPNPALVHDTHLF